MHASLPRIQAPRSPVAPYPDAVPPPNRAAPAKSSLRGFSLRLGALAFGLFILLVSQATATSSSGESGQTIDPLVITVDSTTSGCMVANVGWAYVADLCGDVDGCGLRLITDHSWNVASPALSFAASGQADRWCAYPAGGIPQCGTNGDAQLDIILRGAGLSDGDCVFTDDGISFTGNHHYRLEACPEFGSVVRCTLRIDD